MRNERQIAWLAELSGFRVCSLLLYTDDATWCYECCKDLNLLPVFLRKQMERMSTGLKIVPVEILCNETRVTFAYFMNWKEKNSASFVIVKKKENFLLNFHLNFYCFYLLYQHLRIYTPYLYVSITTATEYHIFLTGI